jgi:formate hydrogenlyase subunit 3/multisubunit Na+/H+ antiporter MnhD subunit
MGLAGAALIALAAGQPVIAGLIYSVPMMHGLYKQYKAGVTDFKALTKGMMQSMNGTKWQMPLTGAFLIGGISLLGIPLQAAPLAEAFMGASQLAIGVLAGASIAKGGVEKVTAQKPAEVSFNAGHDA